MGITGNGIKEPAGSFEIAKRIKELITSTGISLGTISEQTGISKSTLARYVNGEIAKYDITNVEAIAHALNVHPAYLFGWSKSKDYSPSQGTPTALSEEMNRLFNSLPAELQRVALEQLHSLASVKANFR